MLLSKKQYLFVVALEYSFLFLFVIFIVFILDGYSNFNRNFAHYHIIQNYIG